MTGGLSDLLLVSQLFFAGLESVHLGTAAVGALPGAIPDDSQLPNLFSDRRLACLSLNQTGALRRGSRDASEKGRPSVGRSARSATGARRQKGHLVDNILEETGNFQAASLRGFY